MTTTAALKANGSMFKGERPAFVAVASDTSAIVSREGLCHRLGIAAVWIVAIDAGHRPFRQFVMVGLLERGPYVDVATGAFLVDGNRGARHHSLRTVGMHRMATDAGDLVASVARLEPPYVSRLIQVASHADFVCRNSRYLRGIANILGRQRLRVFHRGAVTRLAGFVQPPPLLIRIDNVVRTLLERVKNVFVTGRTGLRSDIRRCYILRRQMCRA